MNAQEPKRSYFRMDINNCVVDISSAQKLAITNWKYWFPQTLPT